MILTLEYLRDDYKLIRKKNWKIAERLSALIELTKVELLFDGQSLKVGKENRINKILFIFKISLRTLQRWKANYNKNRLRGIGLKVNKGRVAQEIPEEIKEIIKEYRKEFKWGSEVIQAHLLYDHNKSITRFKIERYLTISGLRKKYPCTTIKKQKASKKKKHTKKVVVETPGEHTQMDVKYQTHLLQNKKKAYVYNFIDHASNWSFKYAYSRISADNTRDFITKILKVCPFKIKRIQTDNGVEFTFKWISEFSDDPKRHPMMKLCEEEKIRHKLIPPGEKELQGLVERSHRQDDQEFFSNISPIDIESFNELLETYYKFRNGSRRFKKLGWKSANGWLKNYSLPKEKLVESEDIVKLVV
jgi:transposase